MDFRGSRQALSYHDGITELPSDVLARLMAAVVMHGGCTAAGRLRRTCRFFGRLGGYAAMEQGCRAALAVLKGAARRRAAAPPPADEEWMRTAVTAGRWAVRRRSSTCSSSACRGAPRSMASCGDAVYDTW